MAPDNTPSVTPPASSVANTNRWDTRTLVTLALMCAIAILLSFLEFPIFPAASFLKLDMSLTPVMVCGFAYGSAAGSIVGIVCAIAHGMLTGNWVGALMNIIVAVSFVAPASAIYQRNRTFKGAIIGLAVSCVCIVIAAVVANLVIDPLFYGYPFDAVVALLAPAIIPFNIIKGVVNSVITCVVYKSISNLITPRKNQVAGR